MYQVPKNSVTKNSFGTIMEICLLWGLGLGMSLGAGYWLIFGIIIGAIIGFLTGIIGGFMIALPYMLGGYGSARAILAIITYVGWHHSY